MKKISLTIEKQTVTAEPRKLKGFTLLANNEIAVYNIDPELIQWLKDHGCKNTTAQEHNVLHFRFPSDEIKNWFILRWS